MVDWSSLPVDLWGLIAGKMRFVQDYVRFGAVCKSWRWIVLKRHGGSCSLLPLLMLAEKEFSDLREFYCPFTNRVWNLYLPEIRGKRCWGSSDGWLVTTGHDFQICLFNPLKKEQRLLPSPLKCLYPDRVTCSPERFRDFYVQKVVLTSSPAFLCCVILGVCSGSVKMALAKPGDEFWTVCSCCLDFISFGEQLIAVDRLGNIRVYSTSGSCIKTIPSDLIKPEDILEDCLLYLVDITGQLLVVKRYLSQILSTEAPKRRTWRFEVYRLDVVTQKLEEIICLGDWSIFVGSNQSFAVSTSDHPECCSNCIYFTHDYPGRFDPISHGYDMGIYNLENHTIQHFIGEHISPDKFSVPLWIKPALA